jgi:hypothetical protein
VDGASPLFLTLVAAAQSLLANVTFVLVILRACDFIDVCIEERFSHLSS